MHTGFVRRTKRLLRLAIRPSLALSTIPKQFESLVAVHTDPRPQRILVGGEPTMRQTPLRRSSPSEERSLLGCLSSLSAIASVPVRRRGPQFADRRLQTKRLTRPDSYPIPPDANTPHARPGPTRLLAGKELASFAKPSWTRQPSEQIVLIARTVSVNPAGRRDCCRRRERSTAVLWGRCWTAVHLPSGHGSRYSGISPDN